MATNYLAVRAVCMTSLNRQRANIVFSTLFYEDRVPSVEEVSQKERIFERDGILRWKSSSTTLGYAKIGGTLKDLLLTSSTSTDRKTSLQTPDIDMLALVSLFEKEQYILWFDRTRKRATIVLKCEVSPISQLKAWSHALIVARRVDSSSNADVDTQRTMLDILESTLEQHSENFDEQISRLKEAGWDLETASLETSPGMRVEISKVKWDFCCWGHPCTVLTEQSEVGHDIKGRRWEYMEIYQNMTSKIPNLHASLFSSCTSTTISSQRVLSKMDHKNHSDSQVYIRA